MNTYKIIKNEDNTYSVESEIITLNNVSSDELWKKLSEVDEHIHYKE